MNIQTTKLTPTLLGLAVALASQAVSAQQLVLEETIVTARHKSENLQSVPIAVSAFNAETMRDARIESLGDMAGRVPGFQINMYNAAEPSLFIRGIGSDMESAGSDSAIGIFVDGVFVSRGAASATELFDLERVEILRGPQGTLYGKNVVGGAVGYITQKPTDEAGGMLSVGGGNYDLIETKGIGNLPMSDSLAGRFSFSTKERDGTAKNLQTDNKVDDRDQYTLRGHLAWEASDRLDFLLSSDYYHQNTTAPWRSLTTADTSIDPEVDRSDKPWEATDPRKGYNSEDGKQDVTLWGTALTVNWRADDFILTSITAYRDNDYDVADNAAGTYVSPDVNGALDPANEWDYDPSAEGESPHDYPSLEWNQDKKETSDQWSQELRLTGLAFNDKLDWMAGVYYANENVDRREVVDYYFDIHSWYSYGSRGTESNATTADTDSYAGFGQGTWHFDQRWSLTLGGRYSVDQKDFTASRSDPDAYPPIGYDVKDNDEWSEFTPSATLNFQATDDHFFYLTAAEGFKSGGWNGEDADSGDIAKESYDPETATNYELGAKTQWLDNRLQLNGAIFYTIYNDLQTDQFIDVAGGAPTIITTNADEAESKGAEIEFVALLVEGLTLSGSYGYLDAEITGDLYSEVDGEQVNLKGNTLRRSPENTGNVALQYDWTMASMPSSVRVGWRYQDDFYFENENYNITKVDSQYTVDASARISSANDTWSVQIWGKNLTDEDIVTSVTEFRNLYTTYGDPLTYGISLSWNF
ncbi:MAG: TonB-dependent receptor [Halieaceae bacterium]|nr:TonB-dependent receptor [Halieaceae bacterium]